MQPHIAAAMRITCPACAATYEVPDQLIGTGRSLRCRACRHEWHVAPPEPAPAARPEPRPEPPAPPPARDELPPPPPLPIRTRAPQPIDPPMPSPEALAPRGRPALLAAWVASLLTVAGLAAALWLFRADIVAAWPPAARLFGVADG